MANNVYIHTKKAIKAGHPTNRIFIQVDTLEGDVLAWKCAINDDGTIRVPWDPTTQMTLDKAVSAAPLKGENGSKPTAWFKPDSFYKVISVR